MTPKPTSLSAVTDNERIEQVINERSLNKLENANCLETNFRGAKLNISILNTLTKGHPAKKFQNFLSFWKSADT